MVWWGEKQEKNKIRICIPQIWPHEGKFSTGNTSWRKLCLCPTLQAKRVLVKGLKQKSPTALSNCVHISFHRNRWNKGFVKLFVRSGKEREEKRENKPRYQRSWKQGADPEECTGESACVWGLSTSGTCHGDLPFGYCTVFFPLFLGIFSLT